MQGLSELLNYTVYPRYSILRAVEFVLQSLGCREALGRRSADLVPLIFRPIQIVTICVGVLLVVAVCTEGRTPVARMLRGWSIGAALIHFGVSISLSLYIIEWSALTFSAHADARKEARLVGVCGAWVAETLMTWLIIAVVVGLAQIVVSTRRIRVARKVDRAGPRSCLDGAGKRT